MSISFQNQPLTIIKLGGSLFDFPDLSKRLLQFLDRHQFENPLIIPGGGKFADEVRKLDQRNNLGNALSHELGIRTLAISSRFVWCHFRSNEPELIQWEMTAKDSQLS